MRASAGRLPRRALLMPGRRPRRSGETYVAMPRTSRAPSGQKVAKWGSERISITISGISRGDYSPEPKSDRQFLSSRILRCVNACRYNFSNWSVAPPTRWLKSSRGYVHAALKDPSCSKTIYVRSVIGPIPRNISLTNPATARRGRRSIFTDGETRRALGRRTALGRLAAKTARTRRDMLKVRPDDGKCQIRVIMTAKQGNPSPKPGRVALGLVLRGSPKRETRHGE